MNTGSARDAMAYFVKQGWTPEQAAGIVANLHSESGMNPRIEGDKDKSGRYTAYGLAQWHPDRQANFARQFGKDIRQSTFGEQLAFVQYELTKGSEQRAGRALRLAPNAAQAGATIARFYERPADISGESQRRAAKAGQLFSGAGTQAQAAIGGSMVNKGGARTTVETNIGQVNIHTNATDARGIAQAMPAALNQTMAGITYAVDSGMD